MPIAENVESWKNLQDRLTSNKICEKHVVKTRKRQKNHHHLFKRESLVCTLLVVCFLFRARQVTDRDTVARPRRNRTYPGKPGHTVTIIMKKNQHHTKQVNKI